MRFRYEYLDETPQSGKPIPTATAPIVADYSHDNVVEPYRYRLRAGVDFTFTDNFMGGFELESNTAGDSANQSFGTAPRAAIVRRPVRARAHSARATAATQEPLWS